MADISGPALDKAKAKVLQLVPDAPRVEVKVTLPFPSVSPTRHRFH